MASGAGAVPLLVSSPENETGPHSIGPKRLGGGGGHCGPAGHGVVRRVSSGGSVDPPTRAPAEASQTGLLTTMTLGASSPPPLRREGGRPPWEPPKAPDAQITAIKHTKRAPERKTQPRTTVMKKHTKRTAGDV